MKTSGALPDRDTSLSILSCFVISAVPILAYVAVWKSTAPGLYLFLVLGAYLLLGGFAVRQAVRAVRMGDWTRKLGAVGVVGLAATIFLGLGPKAGCIEPAGCASGLTLQPFPFARGTSITSLSLFLDAGGSRKLSRQ